MILAVAKIYQQHLAGKFFNNDYWPKHQVQVIRNLYYKKLLEIEWVYAEGQSVKKKLTP